MKTKITLFSLLLVFFTVFSLNAQDWPQLGQDIIGPSEVQEVSISADGNRLAVGVPGAGYVRIFEYNGSSWVQLGANITVKEDESPSRFGFSVSLSADGNRVAIGAPGYDAPATGSGLFDFDRPNAGLVRIFEFNGSSWVQLVNDIYGDHPADESGIAVSLSADGNYVAIGERLDNINGVPANLPGQGPNGFVRVFTISGGLINRLNPGDRTNPIGIGSGALSISADGSRVAFGQQLQDVGGTDTGSVWVYPGGSEYPGEAEGDKSGRSVSLNADGSRVAIGAMLNDANGESSGHVRIYENGIQLGTDIDGEAAGDLSGTSVSLSADGNVVAIGAIWNDGSSSNSGHVRIFRYNGTSWVKLGADIDGRATGEEFGNTVSLSADGSRLAVGTESGYVRVFDLGPQIVNLFPARGATGVSLDTELVITFDRDMELVDENADGDNRRPRHYNSNNTFGETFERPIRIQNNQVFLTPSGIYDLDPNGTTLVGVGGEVFKDQNGIKFSGIAWDFETIATTDTQVAAPTYSPANGATNILADQVFTITFPEEIVSKRSDNRVPFWLTDINGESTNIIIQWVTFNYDGQQSTVSFQLSQAILEILNPSTTYGISFDTANLEDVAGNDWFGTGAVDQNGVYRSGVNWQFTTSANPPQIVSLFPDRGATDVPLDTELVITFDKDVQQAEQFPYYYNNANIFGEGFQNIRVENNQVFLTPWDLDPNGLTTIFINGENFEDLNGNKFPGIDGVNPWSFNTIITADTEVAVPTYTPTNGATGILQDQLFTVEFDEEIVVGNKGTNIEILQGETNVLNLFGADLALNFDGQKTTISFQIPQERLQLIPDTTYKIGIFEGNYEDSVGNDWRGSGDIATSGLYENGLNWQFTTAAILPDNTPPSVTSFVPVTQTSLVPVDQVLSVTFDELVQLSDPQGSITLFSPASGGGLITIDVLTVANGGIQFTDDGTVSTLTITPTQNLPGNKTLRVEIPAGLIEDLDGNSWNGISGFSLDWQFSTGLGDTPCTSGNVDLEITFDQYAEETSWQLTDEVGNIVDTATYTTNENNTTVTDQFTNLTDGTYTFTIFDAFGDGICCGLGVGSFKVSKNGNEIFSGGQFLLEQAFQFCIDASIDSEIPVITCPTDLVFDAGASCSSAVTLVDPTSTDNFNGIITYEGVRSDKLPLTDPFFVGNTTITWTATDEAGNVSGSCEQTITVNGSGDCWFDIGPEIVGQNSLDQVGTGVTINADGTVTAYISPNANGSGNVGEVTILEKSGNTWVPKGNTVLGGQGGRSYSGVDLNDVGDRLAVSQDLGKVKVYQFTGGVWQQLGAEIPVAGLAFIQKVDFDAAGNRLAVGYAGEDDSTGRVVVYEIQGNQWVEIGGILNGDNPGDSFGRDVSLNSAGTILAVGAYQIGVGFGTTDTGYVRTFELVNGTWSQLGIDIKGDNIEDFFGISVGLNDEGNRLVVGASAGRYAKVFQLENDIWTQLGVNLAVFPNEQPGYQVDINGTGNLVLIGNFDQPGRIYQWINNQWQLLGQPIYGGGQDVAMNKTGAVIILGSPEINESAGKVAIFEYAGTLPDAILPDITCPETILAGSLDGEPVPVTMVDPTATDNETAPENIVFQGTRSDGLELTDPFPLGDTTISWTATDEAGNTSESCDQIITVFQAESMVVLNPDGSLTLTDTNGGASDDAFTLAVIGDNLVISSNSPIAISGGGTIQIDANTVAIPLSELTGGLFIDGQGGNDLLVIETPLNLTGTGNGLTVNNIDVLLTGTGELQLDALSVTNGDYDTNGLTTVVATEANFFENATLSGTGTIEGTVNMNAQSSLEPGVSPGSLATGDLTLESGAFFEAEVNGPTAGSEYDQVVVSGTVTINGATLLLLVAMPMPRQIRNCVDKQ